MIIEDFTAKALEGGWRPNEKGSMAVVFNREGEATDKETHYDIPSSDILLDPKAWEAVGKIERWATGKAVKQIVPAHTYRSKKGKLVKIREVVRNMRYKGNPFVWKENMHRMIDALAEGKTIEQYLETL